MKIVNKLTLRHLKENKGRTVVTTLGICVSVAMITAVFVAVASLMNLFGEVVLLTEGHQHAVLTVNESQLEKLKADDRIERVGLREVENQLQFQLDLQNYKQQSNYHLNHIEQFLYHKFFLFELVLDFSLYHSDKYIRCVAFFFYLIQLKSPDTEYYYHLQLPLNSYIV